MKDWIYQFYENNIMATSWGRCWPALWISDVLYFVLFSTTPAAKVFRFFLMLVMVVVLVVVLYVLG